MHLAFTTMDKEPLTNTYFATLLLTTMPQIPLQKNPPTFLFCLFLEFYESGSGKNSISMSLVNQREFTTQDTVFRHAGVGDFTTSVRTFGKYVLIAM